MPRQETNKKLKVTLDREFVDNATYDVLKFDGKEVVAFHVTNIDSLLLEHNKQTMVDMVTDYLLNTSTD